METSSTGPSGTGPREPGSPFALPPVPSRRRLLRGVGALAAAGTLGAGGYQAYRVLRPPADPRTVIPLYSGTVAYDATGQRVLVGAAGVEAALRPGTRLTADVPGGSAAAERSEQFWSVTAPWRSRVEADGSIPAEIADLAGSALADLWVLCDDLPAPVAAWTPYWRYVWPRDAAFCAVALARVGHVDHAVRILEHLQSIQPAEAWFEARYVPGTDRAPDDRERQFDGTGLGLWAAAEVADAGGEARRGEIAQRLSRLISTSQRILLTATRDGEGMPPASPDYWEVPERRVTIGIMASALAGLRAAGTLTGEDRALRAADAFSSLLASTFGAGGFQRYRRGGGPDSGRAFLDATGCHGLVAPRQLRSLRADLARPAGGIAPGASWREDGISWTPSTSLLGLALARAGERDGAREILHWVAAHRTLDGSVPEKVLFDGRPAAVAPLAWTAANVLLTIDALARA
ncbi:hypothetical protein ACFQS2_16155 [Brachybacterium sp. GCM10030267]|uniref:hypothetical protein n=1 Tax=Brachybacterium sp. GCM10030267 TaxID=3273381 RepID=UPI00361D38B9